MKTGTSRQSQTLPSFVQLQREGVLLRLKVQPRASKNEIGEVLGDELRIRVTAPPIDSAANEALIRLLSVALDCPRNAIRIVRGHNSRHKHVLVSELSATEITARLAKSASRPPAI